MASPSELNEMTSLLPAFRSTLQYFTVSSSSYHLIRSTAATAPTKKLFILDSSFNPPTKAHFRIALSAFHEATGPIETKKLLLLLATNNVDKAPKPASFEERLAMMSLFSTDILTYTSGAAIDIGITKHARFLDKSRELLKHYGGVEEFVYLIGFDTLVRVFDTKYYPESHRLDALGIFFEKGILWSMFRTGEGYGGKEEQEGWLEGLRNGKLEGIGGDREWAGRVKFLENDLGEPVSSTMIRQAAEQGGKEVLGRLLTERVRDLVFERNLYTHNK